jgi:ABC-type Zn2+ transport system substrate-binding protein/surface adhesin
MLQAVSKASGAFVVPVSAKVHADAHTCLMQTAPSYPTLFANELDRRLAALALKRKEDHEHDEHDAEHEKGGEHKHDSAHDEEVHHDGEDFDF